MRRVAILALLLVLRPDVAEAGRLVVLQFEGRGPAAEARLSLVRPLLGIDGLTLVPQRDYVAQAEAAGVGGDELATPSGVRRGAAVAAVDAVIAGRTVRKGNRWHLRLSYYDAEGTRRVHRDYLLVQGRFRANDLQRIVNYIESRHASSSPAVAEEPPPEPPPPEVQLEPEPEAARTARVSPTRHDDPAAGPREDRGRERERSGGRERRGRTSEFGGPDWARDDVRARTARGDLSTTRPMFSVVLVAGGGNRSYEMVGPETSISYATSGSDSGWVPALFPEFGVHLEGFPLRDDGPWLGGLGLEGGYSRGFVASYFRVGDSSQQVKTPVQRIHFDGRFRLRVLSESVHSPEVGVRAGIGFSDFQPEVLNVAFTGVRHTSVRVGIEASQPILPPHLRLETWVVAMPMASPGEAEKHAFGLIAGGSGWAMRLGLAGGVGRAGSGPGWSTWFDRQVIRTEFEGTGTRDDGGTSEEVYYAIHFGAGWAF